MKDCINQLPSQFKYVIHTTEDFFLIGEVLWPLLIPVSASILEVNPQFDFLRFGSDLATGCENEWNATAWRDMCTPYPEVSHAGYFAYLPSIWTRKSLVELIVEAEKHKPGNAGNWEELYNNNIITKKPRGLAGFYQSSLKDPFDRHKDPRYNAQSRYAYPDIQSGIMFGAWLTTMYAPEMCPYIEQHKINTTVQGITHLGRGMFFEKGCETWEKAGRPPKPPVSSRGKEIISNPVLMERYMQIGAYEEAWQKSQK
mmetsp:Transcript_8123/g.12283  ORF Transcript_8123/g.12283 Transcript_8123/m.12283 type:complete len:256 (-) Transcript_8123:73-840(-)